MKNLKIKMMDSKYYSKYLNQQKDLQISDLLKKLIKEKKTLEARIDLIFYSDESDPKEIVKMDKKMKQLDKLFCENDTKISKFQYQLFNSKLTKTKTITNDNKIKISKRQLRPNSK